MPWELVLGGVLSSLGFSGVTGVTGVVGVSGVSGWLAPTVTSFRPAVPSDAVTVTV